MEEFDSIDSVLYTMNVDTAKGIISEPKLREQFMELCRQIDKIKSIAKVKTKTEKVG